MTLAPSAPWDVIVIGAGPGGSTTAALLAQAGQRVLVLEKEEFPRFHIGESLLPFSLPVLARLGVEPDPATFVYKRGAEFICEATDRRSTFAFNMALPGPPRHAWQVERASFDTLLRDRAVAYGATVRHGQRVLDFQIDTDRVYVTTQSGTETGRFLVDASGQDRLIARRAKAVEPFRTLGKAAVFTHLHGLSRETLDEIGPATNDIRVMVIPEGWAWLIPLPDRRLSVGIVSRDRGLDEARLTSYLDTSPLLRRWGQGTERGPVRMIGNYSFRNSAPYGLRYACVGDAACFLDPVFSSGVTLALTSGARLADRLAVALDAGSEADSEFIAGVDRGMERGYTTFAALIDRWYNSKIIDNVFFGYAPENRLRDGVVSVLSGDVWREDNEFQNMLMKSRRQGWELRDRTGLENGA